MKIFLKGRITKTNYRFYSHESVLHTSLSYCYFYSFKHQTRCIMGVLLLLVFQLALTSLPSIRADEYKFCDAKPLGKYCLPDNSGWRECLIDALDEPAEEVHHCPQGLRCGLSLVVVLIRSKEFGIMNCWLTCCLHAGTYLLCTCR